MKAPLLTRLLLFLLPTVILFSCKTKKPTVDLGPTVQIETAADLLAKLEEKKPAYKNLNIRFSAKIKTKKNGENSLKGKLKIGRDSVVWISALPMGIEVARVMATQKEAALIYYLDKKYFQGDYSMLGRQAGYALDYSVLESALTGTPVFSVPKESFRLTDLKKQGYYFSPWEKNDFERIIEAKELPVDRSNSVQAMWFNEQLMLIRNVFYDVAQKRLLDISYLSYAQTGKDFLPTEIKIIIRSPEDTAVFTIEYNKTEADVEEQEYPFTIPGSFSPMELK